MGNVGKVRVIVIVEMVLFTVSTISVLGYGIYRDSVDQLILDSAPLEERLEIFDNLNIVKLKFGFFLATIFFIWLLMTILLYRGYQLRGYCHLKSWVILQTTIHTFLVIGLMKDYTENSDKYLVVVINYKLIQFIIFLLYRLWSLYVVWNYHYELLEAKRRRGGGGGEQQQEYNNFRIIRYSRSPTSNTVGQQQGSAGSRAATGATATVVVSASKKLQPVVAPVTDADKNV